MLYKLFSLLAKKKKILCEVAVVKDRSCYSDSGEGWWWLTEILVVKLSKVVIFLIIFEAELLRFVKALDVP